MYGYILAFFVFLFLCFSLYFVKKSFSKKGNLVLFVLFIFILLAAFFYNEQSKAYELKKDEFLKSFFEGKSLKCGGEKLNEKDFLYNYATQSFVSQRQKTLIIDLKTCLK